MAAESLSRRTGILGVKDSLKDAGSRAKNSAKDSLIDEIFGAKENDDKEGREFGRNQELLLDGRVETSDKTIKGFLQRLAILFIKKYHSKTSKVTIPTNSLVSKVFNSYTTRLNKKTLRIVLYGTVSPSKVLHASLFDDDDPIPNLVDKVTILSDKTCVMTVNGKEILVESIYSTDYTEFETEFYVNTAQKYSGGTQASSSAVTEQKEWTANRNKFLGTDVFKKGTEDSDPQRVLEMIAKSIISNYSKGFKKDTKYSDIIDYIRASTTSMDDVELLVYGTNKGISGILLFKNKILSGSLASKNRSVSGNIVREDNTRYDILHRLSVRDFKQDYYIKYYK